MYEVDVTVTDILMAIECIYFSYIFYKSRTKHELFFWFYIFFAAVAATSVCGALYHGAGFLTQPSTMGYVIWYLVLLSSSMFALSLWMLGTSLMVRHARVSLFLKMLVVGFNLIALLFGIKAFVFVIMTYVPGLILLFYGLLRNYVLLKNDGFFLCASAILLAIIASLMQYAQVSIYFTHNAIYHLLLMLVYFLLGVGGQKVARTFFQNTF